MTTWADFSRTGTTRIEPAKGVVSFTKSDSAGDNRTDAIVGIMVSAAGTYSLVFRDGSSAAIPLLADTLYPFSVVRVNTTGTTGTGTIIGLKGGNV